MATEKMMLMGPSNLQQFANQVKEQLATALYNDGMIENRDEVAGMFVINVVKKTWLGKTIDKMMCIDTDADVSIVVTKMIEKRVDKD